jgi:transcriptional regulator with XRE-family HTH domain
MEEVKLLVGYKIRAVRDVQGISQDYLASKLGVSQSTMSKIENDEMAVNFEKLYEISQILGVDINNVLNFDKSVVFNSCSQSGLHNHYTFTSEDVKEVYSLLLDEKEKRIQLLEKLIQSNSEK